MRHKKSKLSPVYEPDKNQRPREDFLDKWQYRIFKAVLFIIAVYTMWQFLNAHVPVGKALSKLFGG